MLSWTFPQNAAKYDRFLDFRDVLDSDRQIWKHHLDRFVRKFTLKNGKQPLLKSPNHTARIRMILELYPRARFIHIRRNPYDVYRSLVHMASQVIPVWGLQSYLVETIPDMVIDMYRRLYAAYFDEVSLIPAGQFHEISYEDLTQTPVPVLEETYKALNLGDFEVRRSKIENYTMAKSGYQRNRHRDISAEDCDRLHIEWRQSFEAWDYEFSKQRPVSAEDRSPARPLRSADRRQSDNAKLP